MISSINFEAPKSRLDDYNEDMPWDDDFKQI